MLNQRSQNDVRITLISRCRRCQPIFNQISTSKRRRMPAGISSGHNSFTLHLISGKRNPSKKLTHQNEEVGKLAILFCGFHVFLQRNLLKTVVQKISKKIWPF